MKNLGIFISESFFLDLASLKEVKQIISYSISFFQTITNFEMELREFLGLADLTRA